MKNLKVLLLFTAGFFVIWLSACKKPVNNGPYTDGSVVFQFNSAKTIVSLSNAVGMYALNTGGFEVAASNSSASSIQIIVPQNFTAGKYDIASGKAQISFTPSSDYSVNGGGYAYIATSGTLVINSYTTTEVQGTFAFHGKNALGDTCNVFGGVLASGYSRTTTLPVGL
jgi:hypothetical protein